MPQTPASFSTHREIDLDAAIAALPGLPSGTRVMLIGASDTGKTTFSQNVITALMPAGRRTTLIDSDVGQGEIGPPGTLGLATVAPSRSEPLRSLRELEVLGGYFVGAISPTRHALAVCAGAYRLLQSANDAGPDITLIDTDGWVSGQAAVQYKRRLVEILAPQILICLAQGSELDPLLTTFAHLNSPEIWRTAPSPNTHRKSTPTRATRRLARFLAALEGSKEITLSWDDAAFVGTGLGLGEAVAHHRQQFVSRVLRRPVLYAESHGAGGIYIVVNGTDWDPAGMAALEAEFRTRSVMIVPAQKFAGLLLGLVDAHSALLGIGLLVRIDFSRRTLTIRTACRRPAAIAQLWFGSQRLHPDGRERGETRAGEI